MRHLESDMKRVCPCFEDEKVQLAKDRKTADGKQEAKEARRLLNWAMLGTDGYPWARRLTGSFLKKSIGLKDAAKWPTNYLLRARMNGFAELLYRSVNVAQVWSKLPQNKAFIKAHGFCASCGQLGSKDTIAHLLVECPHHEEAREHFMAEWDSKVQRWWRRHGRQGEIMDQKQVANAYLGIPIDGVSAHAQQSLAKQWLHHRDPEKAAYAQVNRFLRIILSKHVPRLHKIVDEARKVARKGNGETWRIWEELATQAEERVNEYQGEARWRFSTTAGQAMEPGLNVHSIRENFQPHDRGPTG